MKIKYIIKYLVASILVVVPLYPKFPFIKVPGTFVSVRIEDLLLLIASLVFCFYILRNKKFKVLYDTKLKKNIILYIVVGLISLLSALLITKTIQPAIGVLHWLRRIEYFVPFFLGAYSIYLDKDNLNFYTNLLLLVVFVAFIYGFGQMHFYWPIIITQNEEYSSGVALRYVPGGHINSTFAGHYDLGTFMIMVLPLFMSIVVNSNIKYRVFYSLGFFSGLWLLVNSASRISLVSFIGSAVLALILINKKKYIPVVLLITLVFTAMSSNLLARYERIFEVVNNRYGQFNLLNYVVKMVDAQGNDILPDKTISTPTPTPVTVFEDRSSNIRLNVEWPRALRAFSRNPLLGTGYSSITLATDNDYLRLLGEVGILGFLSFALILMRLLIDFGLKFPFAKNFSGLENIYVASIFSSIFGVLVNAIFIDVFEASKFAILFWLMIGFAVGILGNNNDSKKIN